MFYWRITWLNALIILLWASSGCQHQTNDNPQEPDLEVKYWSLSTGSKIAYVNFPSKDSLHSIPLIFLHGGPGANQVQHADIGRKWYEHLAELGFDVYIYDQIGSGLSARLKDPSEYTVKRHVEDLEAIRKLIGKEKIIRLHKTEKDNINVHEKVDFILLFYMLHEVPGKESFLGELKNILSGNGKLLIVEPPFHVTKKAFESTLKIAKNLGFFVSQGSKISLGRFAILTHA